jgi:hypothetical protein
LTSFFSFHCILHQGALCAKSLKINHVMDIVVKTLNIILTSALNHHKSVDLLEETGSEHGKLTY